MTRFILVRHGEVEGINPERFRGRMDLALTDRGRRQAAATAARLAARQAVAVYTSPLRRSIDTGDAIAKASGLTSQPTEALNDLDYGEWQWMTHDEVQAESPDKLRRWFSAPQLMRFPGGESLQDLVARTADAVRSVLEAHAGRTVVLVGHDSVNRAILLQMLDQPLSAYWRLAQSPCGVSEIEVEGDRATVVTMNDVSHLEGL
ncbi:MAG: histidine phosphatase family protein [Caulobacterales bacterium]